MPAHRNGCRAWRQGTARLAARGALAERGTRAPCSQTLKDTKIQMLSFIMTAINMKRTLQGTGIHFEVLFLFIFAFQACVYHSSASLC